MKVEQMYLDIIQEEHDALAEEYIKEEIDKISTDEPYEKNCNEAPYSLSDKKE